MKTTSVFWQPALQAPGEIVRGLDDIRQAIQIILRTPRGSDPHRPEFGSNLHLYIDWPVDRAIPHVVREQGLCAFFTTWLFRMNHTEI